MSNGPNVDLTINVNDRDVKRAFTDLSKSLETVEKDTKSLENSIDEAFSPDPLQKYDKQLKGVKKGVKGLGNAIDDNNKKTKRGIRSLDSSFRRSARLIRKSTRGIKAAFISTGIGAFIVAIGALISGFGEFKDAALNALGPVGDFIRDLIDTGRDFLNVITFGIISSSQQVREELEKQTAELTANLNAQIAANDKARRDNFIARQKLAGATANQIAKFEKNSTKAVIDGLRREQKERGRFLFDRKNTVFETQREIEQAEKKGQETFVSELKKRLAEEKNEVEKQTAELIALEKQALDLELGLVKQSEDEREKARQARQKAREEETRAAEKAAREEEKRQRDQARRDAKAFELRLAFILDEEQAEIEKAENTAKVREQEAKENIDDIIALNLVLTGIEEKLAEDVAAIRKKFRDKEKSDQEKAREDEFKAAQEALLVSQATQEAQLRESEAVRRRQLLSVQATEEEIKDFEKQNQTERERQALEFEKQRLELLIQFGDQRSKEEIEQLNTVVRAIDAELGLLGQTLNQAAQSRPKGFLARLLGLDEDQEKAVSEAVTRSIDNVNKLLDSRLNALNKEIQFREQNLNNLNNVLQAEQALLEAGEAANVRGTLDQIAAEEEAREKALKKQREAAIIKQSIDAATQASSLITASAEIFKTLSPIPFVGIPLAISSIALLFGSFAAAQAQAFSAIQPIALNTGGRIMQGDKDTNGGKGLRVEGTNYVVGRGEWIVNADASQEHNEFIKALNAGEFKNVDLKRLMSKDTIKGIRSREANSKRTYNRKLERLRTAELIRSLDKQTSLLHSDLNALYSRPEILANDDKSITLRQQFRNGNSKTTKINKK